MHNIPGVSKIFVFYLTNLHNKGGIWRWEEGVPTLKGSLRHFCFNNNIKWDLRWWKKKIILMVQECTPYILSPCNFQFESLFFKYLICILNLYLMVLKKLLLKNILS